MHRLIALFTALLCAAQLTAQPVQDDLVFSRSGSRAGIYYLNSSLGSLQTFVAGRSLESCQMNFGNTNLLTSDTIGRVFTVSRLGVVQTLRTLVNGWVSAMDLDQDGQIVLSASTAGVVKMNSNGLGLIQTLQGGVAVTALCRNTKTGNFIAGSNFPARLLYEIDRTTGAVSTLADLGSPHHPTGICYMPDTDRYAVSIDDVGLGGRNPNLLIVASNGAVRRSISLAGDGNCVTYNENTQQLYCGTTNGNVYWLSNSGTVIRSRSVGGVITGMEVWDDQSISLQQSGALANVTVRFAQSPNATYCLALSQTLAPGFAVPGTSRTLNLGFDTLFQLTVCGRLPIFTSRFAGTTDSQGNASARFTVPQGLRPGSPIYISGVAVNPALSGGFDVGNTEVVRT